MTDKIFVIKGDFCYSKDVRNLECIENGYLVCEAGMVKGIFPALPAVYRGLKIIDYTGKLIIPGLIDLHLHASQYAFRGLKMDLELLDWLNVNTFPEEAKFSSLDYAISAYSILAEDLIKSMTTRACIFATIHNEATLELMKMLDDSGIIAYVGKVNMDRNSPDYLIEASPETSYNNTVEWIKACKDLSIVKPILTPRFTPSCSNKLMELLGKLQKEYSLPIQSHMSENLGEIELVHDLYPDSRNYAETYARYDLFGNDVKTIMAHCVYPTAEEMKMLKNREVFIAHCPQSNTNLASGIAPVREFINKGMKLGLGTDIAAGASLSMFRAVTDCIQASKLRYRYVDNSAKPLCVEEAFYLATKGGGEFFGKVGSFEEDYEFDAIILDETTLPHPQPLNIKERLERLLYLAEGVHIDGKYVAGRKVL